MADTIKVTLAPTTIEMRPGAPFEVVVTIHNTGPAVEQYDLELDGQQHGARRRGQCQRRSGQTDGRSRGERRRRHRQQFRPPRDDHQLPDPRQQTSPEEGGSPAFPMIENQW